MTDDWNKAWKEGERFPIQSGGMVPWSLAEEAYKTYSKAFGSRQSLVRLAERHGFGGLEFLMLLDGRTEPPPIQTGELGKMVARGIKKIVDAEQAEAKEHGKDAASPLPGGAHPAEPSGGECCCCCATCCPRLSVCWPLEVTP